MKTIRRAFSWVFLRQSTGSLYYDLRVGWVIPLWIFGILGGLGLVVGGICGLVFWFSARACDHTLERMGLEGEYEVWSDTCFAEVGDAQIPVDQIRFTQEGEIVTGMSE